MFLQSKVSAMFVPHVFVVLFLLTIVVVTDYVPACGVNVSIPCSNQYVFHECLPAKYTSAVNQSISCIQLNNYRAPEIYSSCFPDMYVPAAFPQFAADVFVCTLFPPSYILCSFGVLTLLLC